MERDKIIKALECCITDSCISCPYADVVGVYSLCGQTLLEDALALIKELTEENDKLYRLVDDKIQECEKWKSRLKIECEYTKADTVRKMQERVESYIDVGHYRSPTELCFSELDVVNIIRKIAKEMLEGNNDNT